MDPPGGRFATGSLDYEVKLWDFTGLKSRHAFRAMRPCECHPIRHLSYSSSGDALLVISGNAQVKAYIIMYLFLNEQYLNSNFLTICYFTGKSC